MGAKLAFGDYGGPVVLKKPRIFPRYIYRSKKSRTRSFYKLIGVLSDTFNTSENPPRHLFTLSVPIGPHCDWLKMMKSMIKDSSVRITCHSFLSLVVLALLVVYVFIA